MKQNLILFLSAVTLFLSVLSCGRAPDLLMSPIDQERDGIVLINGMVDTFDPIDLGLPPSGTYDNYLSGPRTFKCDGVINMSSDNSAGIANGQSYDSTSCEKISFHHRGDLGGSTLWSTALGPITSRFTNIIIQSNISGDMTCIPKDVRNFNYLSFMVRGQDGNEEFQIGLRDIYTRSDKQSAVLVGDYLLYVSAQSWQEVKIPLNRFKGIDLSKLTEIVICFDKDVKNETGAVLIDNIQFKK